MIVWKPFREGYYTFNSLQLSWAGAESYCISLANSSHLASIQSDSENQFVSTINANAQYRWIGGMLNRTSNPQVPPFLYVWTDGVSYNYSYFQTGQPTDVRGTPGCLSIDNASPSSYWYNVACSSPRASVCKRPGMS